jgi:ABC-2 type transport system permease protein
MSVGPDNTSEPTAAPAAQAPAKLSWGRLFSWSVRRELWEHRSVYLAPLAVAGVGLFGYLISTGHLPRAMRAIEATGAASRAAAAADALAGAAGSPQALAAAKAARAAASAVVLPYDFVTGVIFVAGLAVAIFYSVGALHGERRDRSILFWKSLPVSDLTTVASKVAIPLVVQPLVVFAVIIPVHLIMLLLSSAVLLVNGLDPAALWPHLHMVRIWVTLPYGLVVLALWYAPICGWLMLVSAWARRVPILWALAPPLGLCVLEMLAFGTHSLWNLLMYRLRGGFTQAFTVGGQGKEELTSLSQLDPLRFLSQPGLWAGLAFALACFAACVWLRRRREPI